MIPKTIDPDQKRSPNDFTRENKLPFPKLITFILSITCSDKNNGVDIKAGEFFKTAKRSGLWPGAEAIHRSTLTKARKKVSWEIFETLFHKTVKLAYECFPQKTDYLWHGKSVFAIDGSKYTLPATKEIRETYDLKSGLEFRGKGHFPQCLVNTAYDVFRRLPVARTVVGNNDSERDEVKKMIPHIPQGSVLMFDRGYPSWELIYHLNRHFNGLYLFRCPASNSFNAVKGFIDSDEADDTVWFEPSGRFVRSLSKSERNELQPIKLRLVRLEAPDGSLSVLLTNLFDEVEFSTVEIIDLYFRRWEVETYYRDEKVLLEIERFHSKTDNGIRQELFASLIMAIISRILMVWSTPDSSTNEPQFKNAIRNLASEAFALTPEDPRKAVEIFADILRDIQRVKYYRPKVPRPTQPRVTKKTVKKWSVLKGQKLANA